MIILSIILLGIDLITKALVVRFTTYNESIIVIKNFFRITYVKNTGAAFSFFDDKGIFVIIISCLIILALVCYLIRHKPTKKIEMVAYMLIISGAFGNFLNRIFLGYVIDFIDIVIFGYDYPIFNVADIYIVVGVFLLIIDAWRDRKWK